MKHLARIALTAAAAAAFTVPQTAVAARGVGERSETATAAGLVEHRHAPRAKVIWGE
jgi:hypothetical protein